VLDKVRFPDGGRVQGNALPTDDPFTGDETGVYSSYTSELSHGVSWPQSAGHFGLQLQPDEL